MSKVTNEADQVRPLAALWHFARAAVLLVVAFYCFKYVYFLVSERPADLGLDAASKKAQSAAGALEKRAGQR